MNGNLQHTESTAIESNATTLLAKNPSTTTLSSGSHLLTISSYGSTADPADRTKLSGRRWATSANNQSVIEPVTPTVISTLDNPRLSSSTDTENSARLKLSKRRWAILFAMFVIGATNYLTDDLNSILHIIVELLGVSIRQYIYLQQIATLLTVITILPTSWFVDRYGIKVAIYISVVLILIRNGSKALLFNPDLPNWQELKLVYWTITTVSGAQASTIFFCLPLKISENWFAASERSLAWTLMISSISIGIIGASSTLPYTIHSVHDVKYLSYLNIVTAILVVIVSLTCVTKSKPDHPPSERMIKSNAEPHDYFKSFKAMLKHRDIMLSIFYYATTDGFNFALYSVLQDVLTSLNHSESFAGLVMTVTSIFGLVVMILLSTTVHRVKNLLVVCKLSCMICSISFFLFFVTLLYPMPGWIVLLAAIANRVALSWAHPNFTDMTAHLASGVVSEATVAGIAAMISSLVLSFTRMLFVTFVKINIGGSDYTYSIFATCMINLVLTVSYLIFFGGRSSSIEQDS